MEVKLIWLKYKYLESRMNCKFCNKEYVKIASLKAHQYRCSLNPDKINSFAKYLESDKFKEDVRKNAARKKGKTFEEIYGEERAKEISSKISMNHVTAENSPRGWKHSKETRKRMGDSKKGRLVWNKGLTAETSIIVKRITDSNKGREGSWLGKHLSPETKAKLSLALSLNNKGGRCKWFTASNLNGEEFKVQGTWELKFTSYLNTIDSGWIKIGVNNPEHSFKWTDIDGVQHTYTPDFYCPKLNKYFEVKGYWWGNDKFKMNQFFENNPHLNLEIVREKQLKKYMESIRGGS